MDQFKIPSAPKKYPLDIDNFNGADFTSKVPDISRSNVCENIINRNGFHQVRKSIKQCDIKSDGYLLWPIIEGESNLKSTKIMINLESLIGKTPAEVRELLNIVNDNPVISTSSNVLIKEIDNGNNYGLAILNGLGQYQVFYGVAEGVVVSVSSITTPNTPAWDSIVTNINEPYGNSIEYIAQENYPIMKTKLIKKITGERWERVDGEFTKVGYDEDLYVKISSEVSEPAGLINKPYVTDHFVASDSPFFDGNLSPEMTFTGYMMYDEFDYYKSLFFNDIEYFFTQTGIYTAKLKKMVDGDNVTINAEFAPIEPKIPEYYISATPDLSDFTRNQDINMLTTLVSVKYRGTASDRTYRLIAGLGGVPTPQGFEHSGMKVRVLQSDGQWIDYTYEDDFVISNDYLTFTTAPGVSPLDGVDNVEIIQPWISYIQLTEVENRDKVFSFYHENLVDYEETALNSNVVIYDGAPNYGSDENKPFIQVDDKIIYEDTPVDNPYPNGKAWYWEYNLETNTSRFHKYRTMTECPAQTYHYFNLGYLTRLKNEYEILCHAQNVIIYGVDNANRVFMNNGSVQMFSDANDITYWPDTNFVKVGDDTDITGFGISNGALLTFKKGTNSIYVQKGITLSNKDAFQFIYSQTTEDVLSKPMQIENNLYVFTTEGLKQIVYYNGYLTFADRSYFINKKLKNMDYDKMLFYKWDNNLYVMLKSKDPDDTKTHIFVGDLDDNSRVYEKSSSVGNSYSTGVDYQYEWYYLNTYAPPLNLTQYEEDNYLMAYSNDGLYKIVDDEDINYDTKYDEIWSYDGFHHIVKNKFGIKGYWETPFVDTNNIMFAKTLRNFYMNTNSKQGDKVVIGYKTIDNGYSSMGETIYNSVMNYPDFPRWIHVKDKIRKFMNVKFYITNGLENDIIDDDTICGNCSFNRITLEYQMAGKYRGE